MGNTRPGPNAAHHGVVCDEIVQRAAQRSKRQRESRGVVGRGVSTGGPARGRRRGQRRRGRRRGLRRGRRRRQRRGGAGGRRGRRGGRADAFADNPDEVPVELCGVPAALSGAHAEARALGATACPRRLSRAPVGIGVHGVARWQPGWCQSGGVVKVRGSLGKVGQKRCHDTQAQIGSGPLLPPRPRAWPRTRSSERRSAPHKRPASSPRMQSRRCPAPPRPSPRRSSSRRAPTPTSLRPRCPPTPPAPPATRSSAGRRRRLQRHAARRRAQRWRAAAGGRRCLRTAPLLGPRSALRCCPG